MVPLRPRLLVCASLAAVVASPAAAGPLPIVRDDGAPSGGYLSGCAAKTPAAKTACYERALLADVERSGDAARELPRIDSLVRSAEPFLAGGCHGLMHWVGRAYAKRHRLTLASLQSTLPRSNDPGCSAGFAHGLIARLAPQVVAAGPQGVLRVCARPPTRFRRYTCIHGLGHAYMRMYGLLSYALDRCTALGARVAADCAQGVFHDYWIGVAGRDGAKLAKDKTASPRKLCAAQPKAYVRACWYRTYLEDPPARALWSAGDIGRTCRGLVALQRGGCVSAASVATSGDPTSHVRLCATLRVADAVDCLRGISVQPVARYRSSQLALIRVCGTFARGARDGCYRWLGKALAVVTDGSFRRGGCKALAAAARKPCQRGADSMDEPLVTFA